MLITHWNNLFSRVRGCVLIAIVKEPLHRSVILWPRSRIVPARAFPRPKHIRMPLPQLRFCLCRPSSRPAETLRPLRDQPLAMLVEIDQREGRAQPLVILLQAAIAHPGVVKDALQDAEGPLHPGT